MLERLAHLVMRRRWWVVGAWVVLLFAGGAAAAKLADRWFEDFSIPGYSAYEANQRALETFGTGAQPPLVAVLTTKDGDITQIDGVDEAIAAARAELPGPARVGSWFESGSDMYVSDDRQTMIATLYPAGPNTFTAFPPVDEMQDALAKAAPEGVETHLTGLASIIESQGSVEGPGVLTEALIGGAGALVILLFVFGTLPAILLPIVVAITSILTTFLCIYVLTYLTDVSIIVQYLVALVGLGVAIDYALLMLFRFREELEHGESTETAVVNTMRHAGHSVIVSGSTVGIGLLSMLILPLPFIRSIGLGGMLIPAVSVLASITLLPAILSMLGSRVNSLRVLPRRFVNVPGPESGFWGRWARLIHRRPGLVFLAGLAIVVLVLIPAFQMNPSESEVRSQPSAGEAQAGREVIAAAGFSDGVYLPYVVLGEKGATQDRMQAVAASLDGVPGIAGASAPRSWQKGTTGLVEAFAETDANAKDARKVIDELQDIRLPALESEAGGGLELTLGGYAPAGRDFVHAVYGNFPYVLAFVLVLTFVLLMRAFRSILLPLKAVILNLVSLGAAFGIVVFIFQQGHGSEAIWDIAATDSVISWIPLMIFAFLFGISMDYEVFMLTRMRESYDGANHTGTAITAGLARTGKLVTSAALVLMFAFFTLSTQPGPDIKQFAIGLAAGIVFDATVIRALLVPSTMHLLGRWNWWLPGWLAKLLRVEPSPVDARSS